MDLENIQKTYSDDKNAFELHFYIGTVAVMDILSISIGMDRARGLGSIFGYSGSVLLAIFPSFITLAFSIIGLVLLHTRFSSILTNWIRRVYQRVRLMKWWGIILFVLLNALVAYYYLSGMSLSLVDKAPVIGIVGALVLLGGVILSANSKIKPSVALLVSFGFYGLAIILYRYLPAISNYPLSLDWSESSRFYDASLFFSRRIYGKHIPLPSLDPSRALLQSLPFMIPAMPIWAHRLWLICLWVGVPLLFGLSLARRVVTKKIWLKFGLSAWFLVYAFQGPIYFHLLIATTLVILSFNKDRLMRSLLFIGLASVWVGISRVNWFPVPGVLAAILYILEVPQHGKKFWSYWRWPVLIICFGTGMAFVAQTSYAAMSGQSADAYVTSFNSPLFRYRLFPNEAFGSGVINLMLAASLPLWAILFGKILPRLKRWGAFRLLALFFILVITMIVGLIVSTKIGGGNNLHNLDSYLLALAVITVYVAFDQFTPDSPAERSVDWYKPILFAIALIVPLMTVVGSLQPAPVINEEEAWQSIRKLQTLINTLEPADGEILFIQYRHLLPMGIIQGVDLVPEYEKVMLMEMAMSNNQIYLGKFHSELNNHRFGLIIMEPFTTNILPSDSPFAEENNVWVEQVVLPMTASYDLIIDLSESGMVIMAPKSE